MEADEETIFSGSVGGVDSIYLWLGAILLLLLVVVLATLLRQSGSKDGTWMDEEEWEEAVSDQTGLVA